MTGHPDDEAFLDTLPFDSAGWLCCTRCDDPAATVVVGSIDSSSGPGYDIRHCRGCIGVHLARARAAAQGRGQRFTPSMPEQERL
jgi:hypothetical protein